MQHKHRPDFPSKDVNTCQLLKALANGKSATDPMPYLCDMIRLLKILTVAIWGVFSLSSCWDASNNAGFIDEVGGQRIRLGDDAAYAKKDFDDSEWERRTEVDGKGIYWVRRRTIFPKTEQPRKDQAILIGSAGSYQAFWDGQYIGENGVLATEDTREIPGTYHAYFMLPDSLIGEGEHVLALRSTKVHSDMGQHAYLIVGDFFELSRTPVQVSKIMFMIAGAFLLTAIYFLFLFLGQPKEYSFLIFAAICLIFLVLLLFEYLKLYYLYPYPFQYDRLVVIGYCHLFLTILIPLFFMLQFDFPWKIPGALALLGCIIYLGLPTYGDFDELAFTHNKFTWITSVGLVAFAVFQRKKGAIVVLVALVSGLLLTKYMRLIHIPFVSPFDISLFINFMLLVLSMLYVLTIRRREERLFYEESLVTSERLKNELLKKNIKPHFMMNTLTSLIDWVEESPKEGVTFITALAEEFEVLNQIADYKLIPIGQEIKLCKSHLKVMSYRKEVNYIWEDLSIDPNDIIPPAIIHTAVENGVTHGIPNEKGEIIFRLSFEKKNGFKEYILKTISKNRVEKSNKKPGGTGLKYIRSRLEESHPGKWELTSAAIEEGWETRIRING